MSEDELLTGRAGNEAAQGYEPMPMALPVEPTTALDVAEDLGTDHPTYKHLTRSEESEPIEREFRDVQTGKEMPANQTVSAETAADEIARAREGERIAREQRDADDLKFALDQLPQDGQQPAQQDQQPLDEPQPDAPQMTAEEAQRLYSEADRELETALQNPLLREKLETEFNAVRAESKSRRLRYFRRHLREQILHAVLAS